MLTNKRLGFAALASAALLTFAFASCSGNKETLVIAELTGSPEAPGLTSATVTIGSTQKVFSLAPKGLTASAFDVGVYVPSSVSGPIVVTVTATGGGQCYRGSTSTTIDKTGAQLNVAVPLTPDLGCTGTDGGAGGGAGGTVGGDGGG